MAKKIPEIRCRKNPRTKEYYTTGISRNGEKVFVLGEGYKNRFTEKHRQRLIKLLQEAVIVYV